MDVQKTRAAGVLSRRFFAHNVLACAENRLAAALYSALTLLLSLLFARTHAAFGAYPFALGYLAALDRRVPFAYAGAILGALTLGERGYVYAVAYLALLFLRLFLSFPHRGGRYLPPCAEFFEEAFSVRAVSALVGGLFLAVYQLLAGGLSTMSLAFSALMLLLPVALCLLYSGFFAARQTLLACLAGGEGQATPRAAWWLSLSLGGLAFGLVRAAVGVELLGVSVSLSLAAFFALLLACRFGILRGASAGLLAALGACLSSETAVYIPPFAAITLAAALLYRLGYAYALLGGAAAGLALAYLLTGGKALLSFLPELFLCLALAWPVYRALPRLSQPASTGVAEGDAPPPPGTQRLEKFAEACTAMATVFGRLSVGEPHQEGGRVRGGRNESARRQWEMMAGMLHAAAKTEAAESGEDAAASRAVARLLAGQGAPARRVSVYGARARRVVAQGVRWEADHPDEEPLRRQIEGVLGCRLSPPVISLQGGLCELRYTAARRLAVVPYTASAAGGREVSGDVFSTFPGEGERCYALLADGMGSGQEAAITAGLCGAFLSHVLAAGADRASALRALNTLLAEREGECAATVDLCELDLLSGAACFLKSGAASSYVKRGESLFHIPPGHLPMGILAEPEVEKTSMALCPGDCVILLSDGVSQSPEESFWLCELLSTRWEADPALMAERILLAARTHAPGGDDMTVALLCIEAAGEGTLG